jgi:chorismate mutase
LLESLVIRDNTSDNEAYKEGIDALRTRIDVIDENLLKLLKDRMDVSRRIGQYKKEHNVAILQAGRWEQLLADMVERDYVRRDDYDFMADALKYMKAERDELKAMNDRLQVALDAVEGCDERCLKLEAERDEWKAKAEQAERAMNVAAGKWAKADARSAKRAAAVKRLRGMMLNTGSAIKKLAIALDVKWNPDNAPLSMAVLQNTLVDLLTDDDGVARSNDGVTNLDYLEEKNSYCRKLKAERDQYRELYEAAMTSDYAQIAREHDVMSGQIDQIRSNIDEEPVDR